MKLYDVSRDFHSKTGPFFRFFGRFLPPLAVLSAIATACLRGLPAAISFRILAEITFLLLPFLSGMASAAFWLFAFSSS